MNKTCTTCKLNKHSVDFRKKSDTKDKLSSQCKNCLSEKGKKKYLCNREEILAKSRKWVAENPAKAATIKRTWEEKNIVKVRVQHKVWIKNNPEKVKASIDKCHKANPEKRKIRTKKWEDNNKDKVRAKDQRYRAKKRNQSPTWSNKKAMLWFHNEAIRLTIETGIQYSVDHLVPISSPNVSGFDTEANLIVITLLDNQKKSNKWWPDMPDYSEMIYDPITNTLIDKV